MGLGPSREQKAQEYKHAQEMQRINNGHAQKMAIITQLGDLFKNVSDPDMNYDVCIGYIMQTFSSGQTMDADLFRDLTSKLPPGLPPNLHKVIENVIAELEGAEDAHDRNEF